MSIPPEFSTAKDFLEEFRVCCPLDGPIIVSRDNNDEFLERSAISLKVFYKIIKGLNKSHYFAGPEKDPSPAHNTGITYTFKYPWEEFIIYIKLKVPIDTSVRTHPLGCICLSFHEDVKSRG